MGAADSPDSAAVERLPPCVKSFLKTEARWRATSHCDNAGPPPSLTAETRRAALAILDAAMTPAPPDQVKRLLGELKLLTVPKSGDMVEEIKAQILIYARKLADYPADAVLTVLRTQPDQSKFWPAWAELKERLDARTWRRRDARKALTSLTAAMPTT